MSVILRSIGLEEAFEDENLLYGWVADSARNGRMFEGYTGKYTHREYGYAEIYSCIVYHEEQDRYELVNSDIHVSGPCLWRIRCNGMQLDNDVPNDMTKLVGIRKENGGGFTIMHLLNADILPGFLEDDVIEAQVVAFALDVDYYENEDAFAEIFPEVEGSKIEQLNGKKLMPAMGTILPNMFLHNHMVGEDGKTSGETEGDDIVSVTGIVKSIEAGPVSFDDDVVSKFLLVRVETQFGDLDVIHTWDMVNDKSIKRLEKGMILSAAAVLSGDVAINEYENGMIKDHKHDLTALRYAMIKGNAGRLKTILAEDVVYESIHMENAIVGKDAVIDKVDYVHENTDIEYIAHLATLEGEFDGERCIALAENDRANVKTLVRIEVSKEGLITKITVSDAEEFVYRVDEVKDEEDW